MSFRRPPCTVSFAKLRLKVDQVRWRQLNIESPEVLAQAIQIPRSWYRNDERLLSQEPGKGHLCGGRMSLGGKSPQQIDDRHVRRDVLRE